MKRVSLGILIGAAALALAACSTQPTAAPEVQSPSSTSQPPAVSTSVAATDQPPQAAPAATDMVMGEISAIDGTALTLQSQMQQSTFTVALTDSTQFFKYATSDLASLPVGESISVLGQQDGTVILATVVQVGGEAQALGLLGMGGPGGGPQGAADGQGGPGGQPPSDQGGQSGQPPAGNESNAQPPAGSTPQPGQVGGQRIAGTIESVAGDTIMVKTDDGSTVQVKLAEGGQILLRVATNSADLTVGAQVAVLSADLSANPIVAVSVEIMPQMSMRPQP